MTTTTTALEIQYARLEELRSVSSKQRSVITGTHRIQDLVPAFLHELATAKGHEAAARKAGFEPLTTPNDDSEYWQSDEAHSLLSDLFDDLDNLAPDGMQFSAHPGDASDYGFWLTGEAADELAELEKQANGQALTKSDRKADETQGE